MKEENAMPIYRILSLVLAVLIATGCGHQDCRSIALSVSPQGATADHTAAAPGNKVQFFASAVVPNGCATAACVNCSNQTWTISDPVNVSISNNANDNGTATCLGTTSGAVTVTATVSETAGSKQTLTKTALLTCR
jgi:hypothetical protein